MRSSKLIDISAICRHETPSAFLLYDGRHDDKEKEIREWLPKSQVEDNGDGTYTMPEWLALEKGFI